MVLFWDITLTELLSVSLYGLTAILLLYALSQRYRFMGRFCALASIVTVIGANYLLLLSYTGEKAVAYQHPDWIKRAHVKARGTLALDNEGGIPKRNRIDAPISPTPGIVPSGSDRFGDGASLALLRAANNCQGCPAMVVVPAGVFVMGAASDDQDATGDERPSRAIGIAQPFAIGRTEVTVAEFYAFADATMRAMPACEDFSPGEEKGVLPVTCVSPQDAHAYVKWLSAKTGKRFRLPSEAEWEYAARAGTTQRFSSGVHLERGHANIDRTHGLTARVGSFESNNFGLHDMHGNAAEIVAGCWTASPSQLPANGAPAEAVGSCSKRVLRDAHAGEGIHMTRLSARRQIDEHARLRGVGFRVARDLR